jgi:oxygen-independent coproporphyrinogen-3 oxidase
MNQALKQSILAHDRLVPRYTSYPTAPHFKAGASPEWYKQRLAAIPDGALVSLYVHVPFCPKLCWFCGCHTRVTNRYDQVAEYVGLLQKEMALVLPLLTGRGLRVSHLHFGGGSPTMLVSDDFRKIISALKNDLSFLSNAEIAIEIDPRNIDADKVSAYAECGVNRVSFGIQDFNQKVMEAVNRPQSFDLDERAIGLCRDSGIAKVNLDIMYGLPHQTLQTMETCAGQTLSLDPDRIALFGYAHVPWMKKHMRLIQEEALPSTAERLDLFEDTATRFEDVGYIPVGIDHFSRPDDGLTAALRDHRLHRNFQGYTDDNASYLVSFGASAIGNVGDAYVQNLAFLPQYRERVEAGLLPIEKFCVLDESDILRGAIIEDMMCSLSVNPLKIADEKGFFDHEFDGVYERLHDLAKDDLVKIMPDGTIHALARQAARLACACFDTHLSKSAQARHVSAS